MQRAGFVLAGGQSTRMGRDKALLPWKSGVLLNEVASRAAAVASNISLIADPTTYGHLGWECLPDIRPGLGPLSGIHTALSSRRGELNLIVACDMPDLDLPTLERLFTEAQATSAPCVAAVDCNGVHPLCAVYRSDALVAVEQFLDERRLRLMDLLDELNAVYVPAASILRNCNTPAEWRALLQTHSAQA